MAILTVGALTQLFENGDTPTGEDFRDLIESFRHRLESIPVGDISGLNAVIQAAVAAAPSGDGSTDLTVSIGEDFITIVSSTGDNATFPLATLFAPGLFSKEEKAKLAGVADGATGDQNASEIRDLLVTLGGSERLPASAIDGLSEGGGGTEGPVGPAGPQGEQGPAGADGAAAPTTRETLVTASGITVDIEYIGTKPSVTGGSTGYTLTRPADCRILNFYVEALITDEATDGGEFRFTVVSAAGLRDRYSAEMTEYGDYEVLADAKRTQAPTGPDRITNTWKELNEISGFGVFFNR